MHQACAVRGVGNLSCMTNRGSPNADDTSSGDAAPAEAASVVFPAEDVAPDVEVAEVTADDGRARGDAGHDADRSAQDYNSRAAAPEPPG